MIIQIAIANVDPDTVADKLVDYGVNGSVRSQVGVWEGVKEPGAFLEVYTHESLQDKVEQLTADLLKAHGERYAFVTIVEDNPSGKSYLLSAEGNREDA